MDTNFLALAERPIAQRVRQSTRVVFDAFTEEHVNVVERTLLRLDVTPKGSRLQHHGLEIDFYDEADAALVKLAMPPLR